MWDCVWGVLRSWGPETVLDDVQRVAPKQAKLCSLTVGGTDHVDQDLPKLHSLD